MKLNRPSMKFRARRLKHRQAYRNAKNYPSCTGKSCQIDFIIFRSEFTQRIYLLLIRTNNKMHVALLLLIQRGFRASLVWKKINFLLRRIDKFSAELSFVSSWNRMKNLWNFHSSQNICFKILPLIAKTNKQTRKNSTRKCLWSATETSSLVPNRSDEKTTFSD